MPETKPVREEQIERQQVEQVFGLTGGELETEPWMYWTQTEDSSDGDPLWAKTDRMHELGMMEWTGRYWYEGPPEYVERELQRSLGFFSTLRTLVNPGGMMSAPYRELYDGQGIWKLVARYDSSGEAECPMRQMDGPDRIVSADDERCELCDEDAGETHGYIYLGVCSYEAVYKLDEPEEIEVEAEGGEG